MECPNSDQEFRKMIEEIMNRDPRPELSPAEIIFFGMIGDAMELVGDKWAVWLN